MTFDEYVGRQREWQFDEEFAGREDGALVSDSTSVSETNPVPETEPTSDSNPVKDDENPPKYLFVPFDFSTPTDQQLLKEDLALKAAINQVGFGAAEALLDQEIQEGGYLFFEGVDISLGKMKTSEKVGNSVLAVHISPFFSLAHTSFIRY